jgi:hypothetical protein
VERLTKRNAEEEEEQGEPDANRPPDQFLASAASAAVLALDRRESRHGV